MLNPTPTGSPSIGALGHFDPLIRYVALRLKREHPGWGLPMLRLHMQQRPSLQGMALPKNSTLWRYPHQFGKPYKGQIVKVRFASATPEFRGSLADGKVVALLTLLDRSTA